MADEKTVVVTGGNGFVGRHLIQELEKNWPGVRLVVWDQRVDGVADGIEAFEVDITKPESYRKRLRSIKPIWVVHLAAVAPIPSALRNPQWTHKVNVEATGMLLDEVGELPSKTRVFAISSSDIYGQGSSTPLPELALSKMRPRNPYAESKLEMERMIEEKYKDIVLRARPFPHIGPGQGKGFVTADFASQVADIEAGRQKPIISVGNLVAQRDFTDVRDVVRAYRLLMERGKIGQVYHVASGRAVGIEQVLRRLLGLAREKIKVEQDSARMRPSDIPVLVGDAAKLKEATGWEPEVSLEKSLSDILDWWRERE